MGVTAPRERLPRFSLDLEDLRQRCGVDLGDVIEKILRYCGLWHSSAPRAPPAGDGSVHDPDGASDRQTGSSDEPQELTYVDIDTFLATF